MAGWNGSERPNGTGYILVTEILGRQQSGASVQLSQCSKCIRDHQVETVIRVTSR